MQVFLKKKCKKYFYLTQYLPCSLRMVVFFVTFILHIFYMAIQNYLRSIFQQTRIKNLPVNVYHFTNPENFFPCHVLIISKSRNRKIDEVFESINENNILLIGSILKNPRKLYSPGIFPLGGFLFLFFGKHYKSQGRQYNI